MNVLVIGDGHVYGCGLSAGQLNYVGHFIRQVSRTNQAVTVEAYAHLTMPQVLSTLQQLSLSRYDLIILQLDYLSDNQALTNVVNLQYAGEFALPMLNALQASIGLTNGRQSRRSGVFSRIRRVGKILLQARRMFTTLTALLKLLRPYRHNVLLLTPLPSLDSIRQWAGTRSRNLLLREAGDQLFSVFDSEQVVLPHDEYFLTESDQYLNASSHELLGLSLFEFYQSAPTIVTVQVIKNETDNKPDA